MNLIAWYPFSRVPELARHARAMLVALAFLAVLAFIANTYLGDSTSPYGTCYAPGGRAIPCDAIKP